MPRKTQRPKIIDEWTWDGQYPCFGCPWVKIEREFPGRALLASYVSVPGGICDALMMPGDKLVKFENGFIWLITKTPSLTWSLGGAESYMKWNTDRRTPRRPAVRKKRKARP